jgi:CheY-like chemotaxis protein
MERQGTLFRVTLPGVEPCPTTTPGAPGAAGTARHRSVLVVDDDDMAARAVRRVLCTEHDVSISDGAADALHRIMRGDRFDVIICDLMAPKSGAAFFDELSRRAPECARRIVFLTGGAFTPEGRKFLDRVPNPRLEKPFEVRALRALVNEHLG